MCHLFSPAGNVANITHKGTTCLSRFGAEILQGYLCLVIGLSGSKQYYNICLGLPYFVSDSHYIVWGTSIFYWV